MDIFDAMKGITIGVLKWAQLELPDGTIRMELDAEGTLTKRVRHHGDDRFYKAAFQGLSQSEYEANWTVEPQSSSKK
ncbi:hypothetical protein [Exiguobacterium acetylicum]|uniref:hypothetical protein n=1 Tax=Exiguobacterium acetylicum TaxID=41170 RepID=UPI001EE20F51|nr:hypothetical protein [Exiguobacterium acetylicum]UKS54895.1 hypothetical protein K6T22_10055 [Exiguobacterium acetylicum]